MADSDEEYVFAASEVEIPEDSTLGLPTHEHTNRTFKQFMTGLKASNAHDVIDIAYRLGLQETVASSGRVQAFADAICAIVATLMIVPITHSEIQGDENLYFTYSTLVPKILIYVLCFLTVVEVWSNHARLFELVENVDDLIVLVNLAEMMAITFLPFAFTLLAMYNVDIFSVILYACLFVVIDTLQLVFIWHVFRCSRLVMKPSIRNHPFCDSIQMILYWNTGTQLVICLLAIFIAIFAPSVAFWLLVAAAFSNFIKWTTKKVYKYWNRFMHKEENETLLRNHFSILTTFCVKERLEAFSDGVFSIVATIIILDICDSNVPSVEEVEKVGGLSAALQTDASVFLAYGGVFITVGTLWFIHHGLLYSVKKITGTMLFFNSLSLCCIGILPLGFKLASEFGTLDIDRLNPHDVEVRNEMISIQMNCVCIFLSSFFMSCLWVVGLFDPDERLQSEIAFGGRSHLQQAGKLGFYPFVTIIVFFLTLKVNVVSSLSFYLMQLGVPLVFLCAKLIMMYVNHRAGLTESPEPATWSESGQVDYISGVL